VLPAAGRDGKVAQGLNGEPAAWVLKAKAAARQYRDMSGQAREGRNATSRWVAGTQPRV